MATPFIRRGTNMTKSLKILMGIVVASLALAACGGSVFGGGSDDTIEGGWSITMIHFLDDMTEPVDGTDPYLNVTTEGLTGNTGCNGFFGGVEYGSDGEWAVDVLGSTKMACLPALTAQEDAIIKHIQEADEWSVDGDTGALLLDGETLLELERLDSDLAGSDWEVTGVNNGNQAVASVITGTELTLSFDEDGMVSGSSGCNDFSAGYVAGDEVIHIDPIAGTLKFCESPAGVMDQELQFTEALANASTYSIDGSTLTIRDAEGSTQVTANRK